MYSGNSQKIGVAIYNVYPFIIYICKQISQCNYSSLMYFDEATRNRDFNDPEREENSNALGWPSSEVSETVSCLVSKE